MKHEDDFSEDTKETFLETQEKAGHWVGNEQIEKKITGRSYIRDPFLDPAAGDYEPIQEDSRFHVSEDRERSPVGEDRITKNKVPPSDLLNEQIDEDQRVLLEEQQRGDKIEEIRSTFGALDKHK
ncbi:hypothetical protein [Sporosarcina sp. FSL K6-1508]|uniref:hypothetical protein n=1 Tax=Sporosarcina sp. FSL K6-1508 TaxID=2921553 RepID=UPI0030FA513D